MAFSKFEFVNWQLMNKIILLNTMNIHHAKYKLNSMSSQRTNLVINGKWDFEELVL
jgi:hypothetical protein